jgi:hypothetical protein
MAQVRSATVNGTVKDSSGAVVVGANIEVKNTDTQVSYTSVTNKTGDYTVPYLANGTYSVSITKAGFKGFVVESLHLDPGQTVKADASLTVGATTETVQVQASQLQMQTETSEVLGVTTAEVIDSLPNITQNPFYYAGLQNGVVPRNETSSTQNANSFGIGVAGRAQFSAFGVNGGRAFENSIQLDGLPITGDGFNEAAVTPNLESMQELQVHTSDFSAEYGQGAGVISITTKSGSNAFHGQVSYLNRNDAFNANTAANKAAVPLIARPVFKVNDIGGAVSGPIRKDHLFFSASLHWLSRNAGGTNLATVPTALERTGDFGASLIPGIGGAATPVQLWNPFSVTPVSGATNVYQRAEFPVSTNCSTAVSTGGQNNKGCGDKITNPNSVGLTLLGLYPMPNRTPSNPPFTANNFGVNIITTYRKYTSNNRIDWKRGRHSVYGSGGVDWGTILVPPTFGQFATKGVNDAPSTTSDRNPYAQVGDTIVMSPSLFLDVRYGITRIHAISFSGNHSGFTNYSGFGIAGATQSLFAAPGAAPVVAPGSGSAPLGQGTWSGLVGGQFANKEEHQISHSVSGSVTKIHGKVEYKAGATYRVMLANYTDFEEASANLGGCCANDVGGYTTQFINANGQAVNNSGTNSNTTPQQQGHAGALTLVGEGVWFVRPGANLKPAYAAKDFAVWTQNNWKIRPNLTLNLGLRWEVQPGLTERYNRLAGYDFTKATPFGSQGAIDFPGTNGYSRNLWDTEWHDVQPVLGAAWQITPTFVAHGGYRTTYLPSNSGYFSSPNDLGEATWAPGNTGSQTYGASPNGTPTEKITDAAPLVAATMANYNAPQTYGVGQAYFDRHLKNQIEKQANVFLEKSFGKKGQWLASAGWTGAWSDHLSTRNLQFQNVQLIPAATLSSWRSTWIANNGKVQPQTQLVNNPYQSANCGTGAAPIPFQGVWGACTVQQQYTLFPYPLLQGGGLNGSLGFAKYNSLQARFAHSAKGLHLEANFTWSKELDFVTTAIEDGQGVNPSGSISNIDLVNSRANQNYGTDDQPLRFVGIIVYQSPFGDGGRFALSNKAARFLAGGWEISSVFTMNDGFPVFVSGINGITSRTHRIPGVPIVLPSAYRRAANGSRYNGTAAEQVTLPCGVKVTPGNLTQLKYNLCAFQGPTVTTPNGSILADEYWYGDSPNTFGDIRGPGRTNVDLTLRRQFPIYERFKLEISAMATNLANHPEWNSMPTGGTGSTNTVNNPANGQIVGYGSGTFGTYGMGTFDPRQIQLQGRITF